MSEKLNQQQLEEMADRLLAEDKQAEPTKKRGKLDEKTMASLAAGALLATHEKLRDLFIKGKRRGKLDSSELSEVLEDHGTVCGGLGDEHGGRLDLDLEDERVNPKYAQIAVKAYLQRAGFAKDTLVEIGGMEIGLYE